MDIKELKQLIENKNIDTSFKLFLCKDESSYIIAEQYCNEIAKIFNFNIKYIDSINDIPDNSFIDDLNLYVLKIEEWSIKDAPNKCICICNKTKDDRAIIIPALEEWQVIDFALSKVRGIQKLKLESLIKLYKNYQTFLNDIEKIAIFEKSIQSIVLDEFIDNEAMYTIPNFKIWDLSNAIIKKDFNTVKEILKNLNSIDVEPLGLAKVLYSNFRSITCIQTNRNVTATDLGVSDKQFYVIKKFNCGFYNNDQLIDILSILTDVEYLFKYCELSLDDLIDYLIVKIMRG